MNAISRLIITAAMLSVPAASYAEGVMQKWVQTHSGVGDESTYLDRMVTDGNGNVISAGGVGVPSQVAAFDIFVTKHAAADGALIWSKRYNGPANGNDRATSVAVDAGGNVYVTGSSEGVGTGADYYTAKYAAVDGALVWERRYSGPGNGYDSAVAIAVDGSGNVVVTGSSESASNSDFYTVKYSGATGAQIWEKRTNGPSNGYDYVQAMALDGDGNAIVTGMVTGEGLLNDYFTAKYAASNGALIWGRTYNGPASEDDSARALAVDISGNVIVTGVSRGSAGADDYYTAKYAAADGAIVWQKRVAGAIGGIYSSRIDLGVDAAGNAVFTGGVSGIGRNSELMTAKYGASNGVVVWEKRYSGVANLEDEASKVKIDGQGNVFVTACSVGQNGSEQVTIKYAAADGAQLWKAAHEFGSFYSELALNPEGGAVLGMSPYTGVSNQMRVVYYVPDTATLVPVLTSPAANTSSSGGVAFSLPEPALAGSVKLTFVGAVTRVLTLAGSQESAGPHSFAFPVGNPTESPHVASGSAIPDGVYAVTLSYQDGIANPLASTTVENVLVDSVAPTFTLPGAITVEAANASGTAVNYTASATDASSGVVTSSFLPASGSVFPIGTTFVNATATDAAGNSGTSSFSVTVRDTIAPVVAPRADITIEATAAAGTLVNIGNPIATDAVGVTSVLRSRGMISVYQIGKTTVTTTARDAAGNEGTGSFIVTVRDSTAPHIEEHPNVTVEATSAAGATVMYLPGIAGDVVGVTSLTYSQESGTAFPLGVTPVTITATDAANNVGTRIFTVTVRDTIAPALAEHGNVSAEATSASGAVVDFTPGSATDAVGVTTFAYSQNPGTVFPVGTTEVEMTARDAAGNTTNKSFFVTVRDTTAPLVGAHANVIAEATSPAGAIINYTPASATDAVGVSTISYSRANGAIFPIGTTTVTITARDASNNVGTSTFTVTVRDTIAPVVTAPANRTVEATSASGAFVSYSPASATDAVGTVLTYSKASGTLFPIGTTTVTITGRDSAANSSTSSFTVTVQDTTAPTIANRANITAEASSAAGAVVNYSPGVASDVVGVTSLTYDHGSGTVFPIGETTVTMTAQDAAGNKSTRSFIVNVVDTTNPSIGGNFSPLIIIEGTPLPDYATQALSSDLVGVTSVTQSPAPGSDTVVGPLTVTLTARDGAGNASETITLSIKVVLETPLATTLAAKGSPVLGAGDPLTGIPTGAVWDSFGVPSINDDEQCVVLATYMVGRVKTTAILAFGKTDIAGTIRTIAKKGGGGFGIEGARFDSLGDPLLSSNGSVAFTAKLSARSGGNEAVCLDADGAGDGAVEIVAQTARASWTNFTSVALDNHCVAFTGTLSNRKNGLWLFDRETKTVSLKVLTGETRDGSTVKTIHALVERPGSPGQGRGAAHGGVPFRVTLANRVRAIGYAAVNKPAEYIYKTDGLSVESLGNPTQNGVGALAFQRTSILPSGDSEQVEIVAEDDTGLEGVVVTTGDTAEGVTGGVFADFKDPVTARNRAAAFCAALQKDRANEINAANNEGIWHSENTGALHLVAREGARAVGTPEGTVWKSFTSLALPENRGVVFVATLARGSAKAGNDTGLWATDSFGALRLLLREGDAIGVSKVKSVTVLSSVVGSPAQTRSFNSNGSVIVRAIGTDGAQQLIHIAIP